MAELVWRGKHLPPDSCTFLQIGQDCLYTQENYSPNHQDGDVIDAQAKNSDWANRLIHTDKQTLLPLLTTDPTITGAVNLIYIDPPFMTGRTFNQGSTLAYRDTWNNDLDLYLQWIYETFILLYQLLAPDGSLYVHLDWRAVHYAKLLLDEIFSAKTHSDKGGGFKNEIIWHYQSGGRAQHSYARKHDTILLYTKSAKYCFHSERIAEKRGKEKRNHMRKETGEDGRVRWTIRSGDRTYHYDEEHLMSLSDVWSDISHLHQRNPERTGYATQKPEALLERILLASSEENDIVLDCFCGSGVTPSVAERMGRRWIASDQSELAIATTKARLLLQKRQKPFLIQHIKTAHK